jgi:hypothetical protein
MIGYKNARAVIGKRGIGYIPVMNAYQKNQASAQILES